MLSRQIILDTETTGLSIAEGHRLIEIGCLEMVNRRFTGRHFHYYLNPQRPVDQEAYAVHGLSDDFLRDKPLFSAIATELLAFINGAELIIHNAPFDIGFLNYELKSWQKTAKPLEALCVVTDTLILARNKHPGQSNSLDALCRRYKVDNSNRDLHGALIDAELLGKVYLAMTGGQEKLFMDEDHPEALLISETTVTIAKNFQRQPLPVIEPSSAELNSHQAFLDILKKNGRCVWNTMTTTSPNIS